MKVKQSMEDINNIETILELKNALKVKLSIRKAFVVLGFPN